jgi:hypothetical protein
MGVSWADEGAGGSDGDALRKDSRPSQEVSALETLGTGEDVWDVSFSEEGNGGLRGDGIMGKEVP